MVERTKLRKRLQILIQLQQLRRLRRPKVKKRRCWVREIFQSRDRYGAFETLFYVMIESCFSATFVWPLKGLITFSVLQKSKLRKKTLVFANPFPLRSVLFWPYPQLQMMYETCRHLFQFQSTLQNSSFNPVKEVLNSFT